MRTTEHINLTSIRVFLSIQLAIPLIAMMSAVAQNPAGSPPGNAPAGGAGEAERVIVTGSNIPTAEEVGPNPVLSYNRDIIQKTGVRTTEEFLRDLPVANATGVPVSNN